MTTRTSLLRRLKRFTVLCVAAAFALASALCAAIPYYAYLHYLHTNAAEAAIHEDYLKGWTNHGAWWDTPAGTELSQYLIYLFCLPASSLPLGLLIGLSARTPETLRWVVKIWAILIGFQIFAFFWLLSKMGWLID